MIPTLAARVMCCVIAGLLCACESPPTSAINPNAKVVASATSIQLPQGGEGYIVFEIQRTEGHTKTIAMNVVGAPPGMFAAFHPPSVTPLLSYSSFTVAVGATVPPGSYMLTAKMNADWLETREIPIRVDVATPVLNVLVSGGPVDVEQTRSVTIPVMIERGGYLTAPVSLSVRGLPIGMSARFTPNTIPAGQNSAQLTLTSSLETPATDFVVTIRANAPSIQTEVPLLISIQPSTVESVSLRATPSVLSVKAGGNATAMISATRYGGYTGQLTYEVSGMPPLVQAEVASITGGSDDAILSVNVLDSAPNGSHHLIVRATGEGIEPSTTIVTLHVSRLQ